MKPKPGAQFITASEFSRIYEDLSPRQLLKQDDIEKLAGDFQTTITFATVRNFTLSAAEIVDALLRWTLAGPGDRGRGIPARKTLAPRERGRTTCTEPHLPREAWLERCRWAASFIEENGRLPASVWSGVQSMGIEDFAATLAGDIAAGAPDSAQVPLRKARCGFCDYVAGDDRAPFEWPIHRKGFRAPRIVELTACWPGR
ncbi:MAG: hypothetical protein KIT09_06325 [Bryobacteraceae bacterium]|nr:hypothetical protein [Bryobacteraceae bacterium]